MKVNFTKQHISIHEKENQRDLANGKWKKRENKQSNAKLVRQGICTLQIR